MTFSEYICELIPMAEPGELTGRTFMRTANLVLRFKEYGALVSERWPTRLDLRMMFDEGLWSVFVTGAWCERKIDLPKTDQRG